MKITIDGQDYPFPDIDSITLDEAIILERNAGATLDELLPGESLPMGAVKGFVMVALLRAHPETSEKEVADRIGKIKLGEMQGLVDVEESEADARPPETSSENEGSGERSGGSTNSESEPSPDVSSRDSTGSRGSVTTATFGRETSAA